VRVGGSALLQAFPSGVSLKSEDEETVCALLPIGGRFPGRCRVAVADISSSSSAYSLLPLPLSVAAPADPPGQGKETYATFFTPLQLHCRSLFASLKRMLHHCHSHRPTNFHSSTFRKEANFDLQ